MADVQLRDLCYVDSYLDNHSARRTAADPRPEAANPVLDHLNLTLRDGEYNALIGESGAGKSTLLRLIAGLNRPTSGQVLIDGKDVRRIKPQKRGVSVVFQGDSLYPHMTVRDQIRFGSTPGANSPAEFDRAVEITRIGDLLDRPSRQLSGGEIKRVSLAKSLLRRSPIRLLDEPLAAIDAPHRQELRNVLRAIHDSFGGVTLHVTHDANEAMQVADKIAVLHERTVIAHENAERLIWHPGQLATYRLLHTLPSNELCCKPGTISRTEPGDGRL
ncbi:MAG: ABC transporter ATP-binding protein, partial [Planctomycetota bacterium]